MSNNVSTRLCAFLFFFVFSILLGIRFLYVGQKAVVRSHHNNKIPLIVCTTNLIADVAMQLIGSDACIVSLMGPGVDPHSYKARERDMHLLAQADLILYHGLHLEGKMAALFESLADQGMPVVAVTQSLDKSLLKESAFPGVYDPHVWHDVFLWKQVVSVMGDLLSRFALDDSVCYQERLKKYLEELDALDAYIKNAVSNVAPFKRILVTAHDAFSYFGRAYGFQVIGLQGINTQVEAGMKDIHDLVSFLVANRIEVIFLESSVLPRSLLAVRKGVLMHGLSLNIIDALYSDSLGMPGSEAYTYIGMMKYNIDTIVTALQDESIELL